MPRFRKKPVEIEAVQWNGRNVEEVNAFFGDKDIDKLFVAGEDRELLISTLEGTMRADVNDWIIRGVKGEFYPIKNDIFLATYDPV